MNIKPQEHKGSGIAYITRSQMVLFVLGMSAPVTIPFPIDVVRDLDVINSQKLIALIQSVITQYKLPPASLTLLLANDLLFAKQVVSHDLNVQALEQQAFVDLVPYEDVSVQKIPFNNQLYITVANTEFYLSIVGAFEKNNFIVPLILAAYIFSKEVNFANPLTLQSLTLLMQKVSTQKQFNFIQKVVPEEKQYVPIAEATRPDAEVSNERYEAPKKSNRVFILVGVFIMLIGVLIAVYLWSSQSEPPRKKVAPTPVPVETASPTSTEVITPTSSEVPPADTTSDEEPAVQGARTVKITIEIGNSKQNAVLIEDALKKEGFVDIERQETESVGGDTVINFNSTIPQATKNKITTAVARVYKEVIIRNNNAKGSATITLGD